MSKYRIIVTWGASIARMSTTITNTCLIHRLSEEKIYDVMQRALFFLHIMPKVRKILGTALTPHTHTIECGKWRENKTLYENQNK